MGKLVIAYLGNFTARAGDGSRFNTEAHISDTLKNLGHSVIELQENVVGLPDILSACRGADLLFWTKTGQWLKCNGYEMLKRAKIPTVGVHLDLWLGLNRESEVAASAFFQCGVVATADGDPSHAEKFKQLGVNHVWLNPGVLLGECYVDNAADSALKCDVGFIGSRNYHPEHWRGELINFLEKTYGNRFRLFGANGDSWRGRDLNRLYSSIRVAVGDSCFADKLENYTSDRLFEGQGRGAFQCYPAIKGITGCYEQGKHIRWYKPGDFVELKRTIDDMLKIGDKDRNEVRLAACEHTKKNHTYHNRMQQLLEIICEREPLINERLKTQ